MNVCAWCDCTDGCNACNARAVSISVAEKLLAVASSRIEYATACPPV